MWNCLITLESKNIFFLLSRNFQLGIFHVFFLLFSWRSRLHVWVRLWFLRFFRLFSYKKTMNSKQRRQKEFLSSLTATTSWTSSSLRDFFPSLLKVVWVIFSRKLFLELDIGMKTWTDFYFSSFNEGNVGWIKNFTWLATGSKIDSMVFVWKTGIFMLQ